MNESESTVFALNPSMCPFQVRFITKIWHPNISSVTGAICLDILKDQWWVGCTRNRVIAALWFNQFSTPPTLIPPPLAYLVRPVICLAQGSCYDPADGAAVSTGSTRRRRTRRPAGRRSSEPGGVFWPSLVSGATPQLFVSHFLHLSLSTPSV